MATAAVVVAAVAAAVVAADVAQAQPWAPPLELLSPTPPITSQFRQASWRPLGGMSLPV